MVISLSSRPVLLEPCPLCGSQEAFLLCRARSLVRLNGIPADMLLKAEGAAQHATAGEHHRHYLLVRVPGSGAAMVASAWHLPPILAPVCSQF